ncbi:MAG: plastocyanin/azurin family copper-binding protein [Actinomycetota bacterium]|nr:plastocyanin/azurin family copper-binding protein [Actinomycetota bacterium]
MTSTASRATSTASFEHSQCPTADADLEWELGLEPPGRTGQISLPSRIVTGGCGLRSTFVRVFLAAVLAAVLFSPAAYAAVHEVLVVDTEYRPDGIQIVAGDSVIWRWALQNAGPHTVTALDGSFDSDRDCRGDVTQCRAPGNVFERTFPQPGIYAYRCKVHPVVMLGRVIVEAKPPQDAASSEPAAPPPPPPEAGKAGSQAGKAPARPAPPAGPQAPAGPPGPHSRRMAAVPGMTYSRAPLAAPAPRGMSPAVAPPRDPLSVLPDARPPEGTPEAPAEPPVQLAVEVPATPSGSRTGLVVGVAVATLLATAGVFSKVVLFGRSWS